MIHPVQRTPRCGAQASRLLILGCALALFVAALGLLPTWALAQPAPQPQPAARQTDPISITLSYSEAAPSSEVVPRRSFIDHINAIFAGTKEAPVHAFFRVSVSGELHKSETEPWRVTLVLSQPQERIGDRISKEDKVNLDAESQFMMSMLKPWSVELTQEQVKACRRDGKVSIKLEGPMDHLHLWSGPSSITLNVFLDGQAEAVHESIEDIALDISTFHFDGEASDQDSVTIGGMVRLWAELYPADDLFEVDVELTVDGKADVSQKIKLRRVGDQGFDFESDLFRVVTDPSKPDRIDVPDDPPKSHLIYAQPGDRLVMTYGSQTATATVVRPVARMRFVRMVDGQPQEVRGELLYGVPYFVEIRYPTPQPASDLKFKLRWGTRPKDEQELLMLRVGGDPRTGYTLFRSTTRIALEDKNR